MPNNYFSFKQFTVHQDRTAMKVGTDGVLLGVLSDVSATPRRILDIGTGTGLVALMLAQRCDATAIDAVDIDADAAAQASDNFADSRFASRLHAFRADINDYAPTDKYDLIVSNPPYFVDSLKNPDNRRTIARHNVSLTYESLAANVDRLLSDEGRCSIIIPFDMAATVERAFADRHLYINIRTNIKPNEYKPVKRTVITFSRTKQDYEATQLMLETSQNVKSDEFAYLVKDFYLDK